jgi:PAS domain-containing protein
VISCNPDYFGRVVYSNGIAQEMLEYTSANLLGMSFKELIPEPYKKYHLAYFKNFLARREQTEIKTHSNVLYLSNYLGFIIPVKCLMRLDALGTFPCMMITFIKCKHNFQIALFDETGVILSHSEDFPRRLGETDVRIIGQNLYSLLPEIENKFLIPKVLDREFKIILLKYQYDFKYVQLAVIYQNFEEIYELDATNLSKAYTDHGQLEPKVLEMSSKSRNQSRGVKILTDPSIVYYNLKADSHKISNSTDNQNLEELDMLSLSSKVVEDKEPSVSKMRISNESSALSNKSRSFEISHTRFITNVIAKANNLKVVVGIAV